MTTFQSLLAQVKSEIRQIDAPTLRRHLDHTPSPMLIDVRERDEISGGIIPGALHIPRGVLDLKIEDTIKDHAHPIALYCAGGTRSALAARSLMELGYTDVMSLEGGFNAWKQRGYALDMPRALSDTQRARYARHLIIPEIGERGQQRLLDARVLMIGAGGLGSPAALYLAAAGIGTLGILDSDVVDRSNLQRQIVHTDARVGESKVSSTTATLNALNPEVKIVGFETRLTSENAMAIFEQGWDAIVDGGDNFPTRYLVNDAAVHLGIPLIHGSVSRFEGQVTTFITPDGPCYRCLYPEPPPSELAPSCEEAGVLGVLPGVIGMIQATEVLKVLLGLGDTLAGRLMTFDALAMTFRTLALSRDPGCTLCGDDATWEGLMDYEQFCATPVR